MYCYNKTWIKHKIIILSWIKLKIVVKGVKRQIEPAPVKSKVSWPGHPKERFTSAEYSPHNLIGLCVLQYIGIIRVTVDYILWFELKCRKSAAAF